MNTRTVSIIMAENADGKKRQVGKSFNAPDLLKMTPEIAGVGLLGILRQCSEELDMPDNRHHPVLGGSPPLAKEG